MDYLQETRRIRQRIGLVVFGILGLFLFSSEFMNAVFNNRLDIEGAGFVDRLIFAFKPTVVVIYLLFSVILYALIMRYLKPLTRYLCGEGEYENARKAAINVPRVIIVFQLAAWTIGTTLYYFLKGWSAESGIPFGFGLALKIAVGLPGGVLVAILFNLILIPAKEALAITALREGEDDPFSRYRDYFVVAAIIVFIVANLTYISYYHARASVEITFLAFYAPLISVALYYSIVSFLLIALSKREYFIQIESIANTLERMAARDTRLDQRIRIINYNELGEIAGYANGIVDNFAEILGKIGNTATLVLQSSQTLSSTSQENAAHASQQATGTAEIVATMEEVDALSHEIGAEAHSVEESADRMKHEIETGFETTRQTIGTMEVVRSSNAETITEVQNLDEHVRNIWEIVKIINGIAGQIKIIAFNATLEAASAGEAGKSFEIVASEIRRLADNTVASTSEIRERIEQIQSAAEALIRSSRTDTEKISEAWSLAGQQVAIFETLSALSDSSSSAATSMNLGVSQQGTSFRQVLITLKQLSTGIQEFSDSIDSATETAESLNDTVTTLNEIVGAPESTEES